MKIINKIFENWGLKLVAFLLSIAIWFYVQARGVNEAPLKYNLLFTDIPDGLYLEEANNTEITVWVKGPKHLLTNAIEKNNTLEISLKGQKAGKVTYNIYSNMFSLPSNFQILRIQPEKVTLKLSPYMEKRVKVVVQYGGVRKYKVTPNSILIRGPKNIVDSISFIQTEEIPHDERAKQREVRLLNPSEKVGLSQNYVKVTFLK
jgi:YbbR domain-containing protein